MKRVHEDRDDHHGEQEVRAAPHVRGRELVAPTPGVSSTSFSYAAIVLCSAPWYWNTRRMSGMNEIAHEVADEQPEPHDALGEVERQDRTRHRARPPTNSGQHDEEAGEHEHREDDGDQPIVFSETCSSSGTCWFADHVSAR